MHHPTPMGARRRRTRCQGITTRWPDLFVGLTPGQRRLVVLKLDEEVAGDQAPTRDEVDDMVQYVVGEITEAEYIQRRSQAGPAATGAVTS